MAKRVEITVGYTTNENLVAVGLAEMNASVTGRGGFEVEVTSKTGSAEDIKEVIESLCPYGRVEVKD